MSWLLRSPRLGFRRWRPDDRELAAAIWGDPAVTRFVGGPLVGEGLARRLADELSLDRSHGYQYWPIFLVAGGDHVGCCGLHPHRQGVLELGVHLRPPFWGLGLAEEAALAVIGHAFSALGARALFAGHHPDNESSRRLLRKLGFGWVGDQLYAPTGLRHPSYLLLPDGEN